MNDIGNIPEFRNGHFSYKLEGILDGLNNEAILDHLLANMFYCVREKCGLACQK